MVDLKSEFKLTQDGDPWGNAMIWHFNVADELFSREGYVPKHWHYRPSPFGRSGEDDPEDYLVAESNTDDLVTFGNLLCRYTRLLRHLGHDY